jgi:2'-hydroxyisoflavone reductase
MRILVIGGTRFVGRALVEQAQARGHELTLFHRGQTNPGLFTDVEVVLADRRSGALRQLSGRAFDVVLDTCANHPDDVMASAPLTASVDRYILISTASVYRPPLRACADETAPVWSFADADRYDAGSAERYGALKTQCEWLTVDLYGKRALILRPGIVIGPHDPTDRLTSWLRRLGARTSVLAGRPAQPLQLIDVRDLATFTIEAAEAGLVGFFHATGQTTNFASFIDAAVGVLGATPEMVWAGDEFLHQHDVQLPFYLPELTEGLFRLSNRRASDQGLRLRALRDSLSEVLAPPTTSTSSAELDAFDEDELIAHLRR